MILTLGPCEERREMILQGNQTLVLEESGAAWRVESGTVAVFAVEMQDGSPRGRRRHLFDVAAGEILLGMKSPQDAPHALMAVPVQPAVLASLQFADLGRAALEAWRDKLGCGTDHEFFEGLSELDRQAETEARSRLQEQLRLNRRLASDTGLDLAGDRKSVV